MIQLVAFDLDGTLFDSEKRISDDTINYLENIAKKGIEIVPTTGRAYMGLMDQVEKIQGINYVITSNGAGIYTKSNGKCIRERLIPLDEGCKLLEELLKFDIMCDPFIEGESYMSRSKYHLVDKMHESEGIKDYIRKSRNIKDDLVGYVRNMGKDFEKITINFVPEDGWKSEGDGELNYPRKDFEKVREVVGKYTDLKAISGGMRNIEITAGGVDKGDALKWLCDKIDIPMSDVIAFGDSGNDIEMISVAGIGVAMENAEESAKKVADYITLSNDKEGVLAALKKFLFA